MPISELNNLTRAEQLFDDGKLDEALELLTEKSLLEGPNSQKKGYTQYLKGMILLYQDKIKELIKCGEEMFKEAQKNDNNLQALDGLFFQIFGLSKTYEYNEAHQLIEKAEILSTLIPTTSKRGLIQKKARISVLKGRVNLDDKNLDLGEKILEEILNSAEEIGKSFEIVWANLLMARIMFQVKHSLNLSLEYSNKALLMAKEIKYNHYWIAYCHIIIGLANYYFCEYDTSLKHRLKSLEIAKKINNNWFIAWNINDIGVIYSIIGDYDIAIEYFKESLLYREDYQNIHVPLHNLLLAALEKDDVELAQKYFNRLENYHNQKKASLTYMPATYSFSKALMLKRSSRIRDIAKAEEILKNIAETENEWPEWNIDASIHLCDLLLAEFRLNKNEEVLDEVNYYLTNLLTLAEKQHSYLVFCETFILKAKLALLNFDLKSSRRFLTQAQNIAESYGIKRLAMKISYEHDILLKQTKIWEKLKETKSSIAERWKLADLNEHINDLVKKRMVATPELSNEEPILLLIISEGGIPFFSHLFEKEMELESHLLGGFLTTIDYFIKETFSEGLNRASFGEHTLIMEAISPFLICYIYKGASYYALQRVKSFIEKIQNNKKVWEILEKFYQSNRIIQKEDIPSLNMMVSKIFIEKNIPSE